MAATGVLKLPCLEGRVSTREWQARVDLAPSKSSFSEIWAVIYIYPHNTMDWLQWGQRTPTMVYSSTSLG